MENIDSNEVFSKFKTIIAKNAEYMPMGNKLKKIKANSQNYQERCNYRLERYLDGKKVVKLVEHNYFPVKEKMLLDIACGFGGQLITFIENGAQAIGLDFIDYNFGEIQNSLGKRNKIFFVIGDMKFLPFNEQKFDIIYSSYGLEHLQTSELQNFLADLKKILNRQGVIILEIPVALKGIFNDPHYSLPFVSMLPASLKINISEKIFKRGYPWKIHQTFFSSSMLKFRFRKLGFRCEALLNPDSKKAKLINKFYIIKRFKGLIKEIFWDYIVLTHN